jgi:hypothetical protein
VYDGLADNWQQMSDANFVRFVEHHTHVLLRVYVDKVGEPGNLCLLSPAVFVM